MNETATEHSLYPNSVLKSGLASLLDDGLWNKYTADNLDQSHEIQAVEDAPPNDEGHRDTTKRIVEQKAADMAANRELRKLYADKAYNLASGCLSGWMVALGAQGVIKVTTGRDMWSDTVLLAMTTGVTVSVLAAFLGVIRGLFPHSAPAKDENSQA
jgi:hypothetical protein